MKKLLYAVLVCVLASQALALPMYTNLMPYLGDPGFENGLLDPWVPESSATLALSSEAHTGNYSMSIVGSGPWTGAAFVLAMSEDMAQQKYRFEFDAKDALGTPDNLTTHVQIVFYVPGPTGYEMYVQDWQPVNEDWAHYSFEAQLVRPFEGQAFKLIVQGCTGDGTYPFDMVVDDVSWMIVPEPITALMLGLGGLLVRTRSKR